MTDRFYYSFNGKIVPGANEMAILRRVHVRDRVVDTICSARR